MSALLRTGWKRRKSCLEVSQRTMRYTTIFLPIGIICVLVHLSQMIFCKHTNETPNGFNGKSKNSFPKTESVQKHSKLLNSSRNPQKQCRKNSAKRTKKRKRNYSFGSVSKRKEKNIREDKKKGRYRPFFLSSLEH